MNDKKKPAADMRCCWNCKHWHKRDYTHCQHSGPWGGDIQGDARCTFEPAKRIQIFNDENEQLRQSLKRCLNEAEGWLDDARGCKPEDIIGYDGWADEARRLISKK